MNSAHIEFQIAAPATMATNGMRSHKASFLVTVNGETAGKLSQRGAAWMLLDYDMDKVVAFSKTLKQAKAEAKRHFSGKLQAIFTATR